MARIFAATSDLTRFSTWWCDQLEHRLECMQDQENLRVWGGLGSWKRSCKDRSFIVHLEFQAGHIPKIFHKLMYEKWSCLQKGRQCKQQWDFSGSPWDWIPDPNKEIWEVVGGAILTPKPTPQGCSGCLQPGSTGETWWCGGHGWLCFESKGVPCNSSSGVWDMSDDFAGWNQNDQPTNIRSANKHSTTESYTVKIQQIDMSKTVPRFAGGCPYHEQKTVNFA